MAGDGITTRLQKDMGVMQKDMGLMQQELAQLQTNVSQMDTRIESRFKEFHETIKVGIQTELQNFFDQYVGRATPTTQGQTLDKGKEVLGGTPLGFPPKESLLLSLIVRSSHGGINSRASTLDSMGRNSKFECPRFDKANFRRWWSKLEQFFEAEGILEQDKETYVCGLQERFGSFNFTDPMTELVTLK
ncbi:hypothetical protein CXB51_036012 [Gossypium anomalum]|uniref:Uncharacterized protein n=1 Tax=Gossypium anomalum TaxID=47600 RepID=A0A8J5XPI2_9ROSI|nr:hypothetical protein CXB51_036012 [Gossypium anomalum]